MKLDIGCGERPRAGYVGVDIRPLAGVRYVCRAWELIETLRGERIEEIYSRHMLEHLAFHDARRTLAVWHRVLLPGGMVRVIVPDLAFHARQVLDPDRPSEFNPDFPNLRHALAGLYGWQRHEEDLHRSGWTEATLRQALEAAGFREVERVYEMAAWHLEMRGRK